MKIQNHNLIFFDTQTDEQMDNHKAICPFNFFKIGYIFKISI